MSRQEARIEELQARVRWLESEHERVSWLFDAVPVGFVLMDEHGNAKEFNAQFENMLGFKRGFLGPGSLARLILQPDLPVFLDHLRRCKSSQEAVSSELRMRNGTRSGLPVEIISLPPQDAFENPALYRTAIIDLTKRRVTEQRLADTLQSFGTLLDTVEGIVWEADAATLDVTFVSRYAETVLGYPVSQWLEHGFWERHIYVDDRELVMQEISRAVGEKQNVTVDYRVFTADRRLLWFHDRISMRMQGGKMKVLGIAVDITAQKDTEAELEKERANLEQRVAERTAQLQTTISELEAFSYSLSHDMRAPLRAMEGYTQLLRNILGEKLGPKEIDYFGRIMASAERLDNLIQDVLQYSRVARAPLELKEINLEKIVCQVISDYPTLQPPDADIQVEKPLSPVMGHDAFLTQCISNLLSNAVKFVAPGVKPKVRVRTKASGNEVRLWVEDNGIGIPTDSQKQIFGIFQRLHAHNTYPGTGIGLAIVQKAVQRMGGRVGVESAVGKGSKFWLQLKRPGRQ
jgi:PAS domain S-box-containing protein